MKPNILLLATDLDGTLLDSQSCISSRNRTALQHAHTRGIRIIIATTRNLDVVQTFCRELELNEPVICANGAHILSAPEGKVWAYRTIPQDVALQIAQCADDLEIGLSITVQDKKYLRHFPGLVTSKLSSNVIAVDKNQDGVTGAPLRILTWDPAGIEVLRTYCATECANDCYTTTYYNPDGAVHSLGIFAAGADKGNALALVLDKLEISQNQAAAVGDNQNDLPLFTQAGIRVAVANATPELTAAATHHAPHHNEDALAWVVEQLI